MPAKAPASRFEDAIQAYTSGRGCHSVASEFSVGAKRLREELQRRGLWRSKTQTEALVQRARVRPRLKTPLPMDEVIARYEAGESINALAKAYGVSRTALGRRFKLAGVQRRGQVEANRLMMAERTPEENARNVAAAHDAIRGVPVPMSRKIKHAKTVQRRRLHISETELELQKMFEARGVKTVNQQAVGPYNIDLGAKPVAVEVFGGQWHNSGRHLARFPKRSRYLFDAGWNQFIIWVTTEKPLEVRAVDKLVAFIEVSRRDPSFRRQHRMIWGDGDVAAVAGFEID